MYKRTDNSLSGCASRRIALRDSPPSTRIFSMILLSPLSPFNKDWLLAWQLARPLKKK